MKEIDLAYWFQKYLKPTIRFFDKVKVYKKNESQIAKILGSFLRTSRGSISKIKCFSLPKIDTLSLFHYCIQNVKDGIQIRVYKINKESVTHFSQFLSVKFKKILRKYQAQFREKLRHLRLRRNDGFLIK